MAKQGRPSKRTDAVEKKIIAGLEKGTPLTVICSADDMPGVRTVYDWIDADEKFSADIARARDIGFDQIAVDALDIADDKANDTIIDKDGNEKPNTEWITRSRLRVDTRLKLLAKWNPKKYGDRIDVTSGNEKLQTAEASPVAMFSRLAAMAKEAKADGFSDDT